MSVKVVATLFFFVSFLLSGSSWLIQKPFVRPLSNTRNHATRSNMLTDQEKQFQKTLVVPGIEIPIDGFSQALLIILSTIGSAKEEAALVNFTKVANAEGNFVGKAKSDPHALDNLQSVYLRDVVKNKANLPANYQYFGNGNNEEILKQMLLHNPFYTSALLNKGDTWSISSYAKEEGPTRYSKLLTAYDASMPRVNVKLNRNNLDIASYQVFDSKGNDITYRYTKDEAVKILLFTLFYYSEVIHAAIHIYDFINVLGLLDGTEGSALLVKGWALSYLKTVPLKYKEVEVLLFSKNGALVGGGFKSDRTQVLQYVVDELLRPWLHMSTADQFINEFVFSYIPKAQRTGFLPEFLDQANLIPQFTADLTATIKALDQKNYDKMNGKLEDYYHKIGNDISNIKDIGSWLQVMSAINIVHGTTFSFSRCVATPAFLPYLDFENKGAYTANDQFIAVTVLATTFGLLSDRYVFSSELLSEISPIKSTLKIFNEKSNALKTKHFDNIKKDSKFSELGWIWTDFGPDLIDNKQLTMTTYV